MRSGSGLISVVVALQLLANMSFWVAASRVVDADALGHAGELFTSMQFVVYLTGMGLTVANSRFGADGSAAADGLLTWSLLVTTATSLLGAAMYLGMLSVFVERGHVTASATLDLVTSSAGGIAALFVLVAGASLALLVDVRLMAARRYDVLIARAVLIGLARLPLLLVDHPIDDALWLFAVVSVPTLLYGLSGVLFLPRLAGVRYHLRPKPREGRRSARFAAVNYVATLALEAPQFALPVVVGLWVSGAAFANFFIAWGAAAAVLLLPAAIAQVSLVEGARTGDEMPRRAAESMAIALGIAVVALAGSFIANDLVTVVYGSDYTEAARLLPLFVAAAVPWAISSILLTEARIRKDHLTTVAITATLGIGTIVPALVLVPDRGVDGAVAAWLAGNVAAALTGAVLTIARRSDAPGSTSSS